MFLIDDYTLTEDNRVDTNNMFVRISSVSINFNTTYNGVDLKTFESYEFLTASECYNKYQWKIDTVYENLLEDITEDDIDVRVYGERVKKLLETIPQIKMKIDLEKFNI